MVLTGKSKATTSSDNWGMGFLLVFFPEHPSTAIADQTKLFPSSPNSLRRPNFNLLTKAQSTISLCALLVFLSLLLFTLSTFDPAIKTNLTPPRRFLSSPDKGRSFVSTTALQGLGTLYMRGTRAMSDLAVFHVTEDVGEDDLRLFLRLLHRSGATAKSDSVFIFPSPEFSAGFSSVIREENESFLKLVHRYRNANATTRSSGSSGSSGSGFDVTQFVKRTGKEMEEPLWGKRIRRFSNDSGGAEGELTRLSYGSVVSFDAAEIDPENSLAGFLDPVPMNLRRWASYPMLLGRVRRNFKHIMLVDLKNSLLLGDPLNRVRSKSTESVLFFTKPEPSSSRHSRKNSDKTHSHNLVNSGIILGGARGIRRLSSAMVVEIARVLMQHKKRNSVSESGVLSHLVNSEFVLKNVKVITTPEPIPEASSLASLNSNSVGSLSAAEHTVVQRGNNIDFREINSVIMKQICMSEIDSSVYSDCFASKIHLV